jgi:prepilin-type N-terminal cleavage/methylation domain-containing protein/prepilin-type processing-associated H-X9-DG protein
MQLGERRGQDFSHFLKNCIYILAWPYANKSGGVGVCAMSYAGKNGVVEADAARTGWGKGVKDKPCPAARKSCEVNQLRIIRHQSSIIHRKGFTLIELLVVISIVALLLAILMPALKAARSHARAATCQGTLHQWGLYYAMYTAENDYKLPTGELRVMLTPDVLPRDYYKYFATPGHPTPDWHEGWHWNPNTCRTLLFCPEATTLPEDSSHFGSTLVGRTHSVWAYPDGPEEPAEMRTMSSYGLNHWTPHVRDPNAISQTIWVSCLAKGAATVPIYFDCMLPFTAPYEKDVPLLYEDTPSGDCLTRAGMWVCTMDRHRGGINSLFMDWSVRKVGVKELWTLDVEVEPGIQRPGSVDEGRWRQARGLARVDAAIQGLLTNLASR